METLLEKYDRLVIFDTETTGLDFEKDEIIELAAAVIELRDGKAKVIEEYDNLVRLSVGMELPQKIQELTHIEPWQLETQGIGKDQLCQDIARLFGKPNTLLLAYNAHFDLCFLFYTLRKFGDFTVLRGKDKLDLLTVYRDRRAYPHRLESAINAYGLKGKVKNSHRAIDDVLATVAVMEKMIREKNDLLHYVNLFGYNARYGVGRHPISSVSYRPQGYEPNREPLYLRPAVKI